MSAGEATESVAIAVMFTEAELDALRTWRDRLDELGAVEFDISTSCQVHRGSFQMNVKCEPAPGLDLMQLMFKVYDQAPNVISGVIRRVLSAVDQP